MLASYNSGPGNFLRWGSEICDNSDPLLFIEAIPVTETRAFVAHALVYSWIYAARMHLPPQASTTSRQANSPASRRWSRSAE